MVHDDPYSSPLKPNQQPHELKKPRPNNPRPPGPSPPSPSPTTILESTNEQDSNNNENYSGNPTDLHHDNSHDNSNNIDDVGGDGNYHVHDSIGSPSHCPLETSTPATLPVIVNNTTRNNPRPLHLSASSSISHHSSSPLSFLTILKSKLCRLFFCIPSSTTTTSSDHHH
ncbi:hypothetical protein INT45_004118 [Circinella minor]|uniref:Uncharacterized protein n=1 Tax=Circinella minor TaxID=1195481 RepID=A0A8H7RWP3_9FUNG|nr:hypothetical protein INT45_004118 [Circinella minor]